MEPKDTSNKKVPFLDTPTSSTIPISNKGYINTGKMPQPDFVVGMFKEGGIPDLLTSNDKNTKDNQKD